MRETQAALFSAVGEPLRISEVRIDEPEPNEVLVAVAAVGLCHSDLHYLTGDLEIRMPAVLGHEAAGVVEAVGSNVRVLKPGDRVAAGLTPSCGICAHCESGRPTICLRTAHLRERKRPAMELPSGDPVERLAGVGGFARHLLLPQSAAVKLPDEVPLRVGCLLACCIVTGVGAVFRGARVRPGSTVAVIGCGGVGTAIIQGARLAGASAVLAIDVQEERLESAKRYGATHAINTAGQDPVAAVDAVLPGGVEYAFEAVGSARTAETALSVLRAGGTACLVGIAPEGTNLSVSAAAFFFAEKRLIGSYMGSSHIHQDIAEYSRLYAQGSLLLDEMVSDVIRLEAINEGFIAMRSGGVTRIVVDLEG